MEPDTSAELIGLRIRAARNRKKMTAKALSLALGWPPTRISRIERAELPLFVSDLVKIAGELEYRPADFLEEEFPYEKIEEVKR